MTADEFLVHPAAAGKSELVRGELRVMTPAGGAHGLVAGEIFSALTNWVRTHGLGICFPDNTGFMLPGLGDTIRSPDVAFVSTSSLPPEGISMGWVPVTPDLVVEVLSPSESWLELEDKLRDYDTAGTRLVWIVDPVERMVVVRRRGEPERRMSDEETLDGSDVIPGFRMLVASMFAGISAS